MLFELDRGWATMALVESTSRGAIDAQRRIDSSSEEVKDAMLQMFWSCFMTFSNTFVRCGEETRSGGALVPPVRSALLVLSLQELVDI